MRWKAYVMTVVVSLLASTVVFADQQRDDWAAYVDGSVGRNFYYLYQQVMYGFFQDQHQHRAINFGAGAGDVDVDLAAHGWDVTSVDLSPRAGEVIGERMKFVKGRFHFQQKDFSRADLTGNYDLITSFFALPFGGKNDLPGMMKNIAQHTKSGSVLAVNFFGNEHSFVKQGQCYGMSKDEVYQLMSQNGFEIRYFLNRYFSQPDFNNNKTYWDVLDVIAVKL